MHYVWIWLNISLHLAHTHSAISSASVWSRLLAVFNACSFFSNGKQNCRAEQKDGSSTSDAVWPREVPLRNVELNTILIDFRDEHDRIDNDSRQQEQHCRNITQLRTQSTCMNDVTNRNNLLHYFNYAQWNQHHLAIYWSSDSDFNWRLVFTAYDCFNDHLHSLSFLPAAAVLNLPDS